MTSLYLDSDGTLRGAAQDLEKVNGKTVLSALQHLNIDSSAFLDALRTVICEGSSTEPPLVSELIIARQNPITSADTTTPDLLSHATNSDNAELQHLSNTRKKGSGISVPVRRVKGVKKPKQSLSVRMKKNYKRSDTRRIAIWGNIDKLRKLKKTKPQPLSVKGKLFTAFWSRLGGLSNIIHRLSPKIEAELGEIIQQERYASIVQMALVTDPTTFRNLHDIVNLLVDFVKDQSYSSATVRAQRFRLELKHIYDIIGDDQRYENGFERPQKDIPYPLQKKITKILVKEMEGAAVQYIEVSAPQLLQQVEIDEPGVFELSNDNWQWLLVEAKIDLIFRTEPLKKLQKKSVGIRNLDTHRDRQTAGSLAGSIKVSRKTVKTLLNLAGKDFSSSHIKHVLLHRYVNTWKTWSADEWNQAYPELCRKFAAIPHGTDAENAEAMKEAIALNWIKERRAVRASVAWDLTANIDAIDKGKRFSVFRFPGEQGLRNTGISSWVSKGFNSVGKLFGGKGDGEIQKILDNALGEISEEEEEDEDAYEDDEGGADPNEESATNQAVTASNRRPLKRSRSEVDEESSYSSNEEDEEDGPRTPKRQRTSGSVNPGAPIRKTRKEKQAARRQNTAEQQ